MPGAQDRWDQLAEPSVRSQEATPPDRSRLADRPERGSLADLRQRLERLPAGHPSSPYNDDLTRKLPVTSLKDLELPLTGADLNGAAKHHDHGLAEGPHRAPTAQAAAVEPRATTAPAAAASPRTRSSTADWTSATDVEDPADALDDADGVSAPDQTSAAPATATAPRPTTSAPPTAWGRPTGQAVADPADGEGLTSRTPTTARALHDWLSAPAWGSPADLSSHGQRRHHRRLEAPPAGTARRTTRALTGAARPSPAGREPEPAADTLSHGIFDTEPNHASDEPLTGPDGSWGWNGRYLTPEERQVAEQALGRCRVAEGRNVFGSYGHSGLTPAMRRIEAQLEHGQLLPDTESCALKSRPTALRKGSPT